jgi:CRP/FNR family nitrogen fixation transcriptional regulator
MLFRVNSNRTDEPKPSQLDELVRQNAAWKELRYLEGSEIFGEAEPTHYLYQVRQGAVRTYKLLSDGRRQIGAFHLPGDVFGVENDEVHRFTAEAIIDTVVWFAKRRSLFAGLTQRDVSVTKNVTELVARSLEHVENHLVLLGRLSALERVAAFLVEMDRRGGKPDVMVLPMNRCDIADYLGLSAETVARAISTLRGEGILSLLGRNHREIVLHDRAKLDQRAWSPAAGTIPKSRSGRM